MYLTAVVRLKIIHLENEEGRYIILNLHIMWRTSISVFNISKQTSFYSKF